MLNDRKANDDHRFINEIARKKEHACRQQHYTNYYFSDKFFVFRSPSFRYHKKSSKHRICLMTFDHKLKIKCTVTNIFMKEMKCRQDVCEYQKQIVLKCTQRLILGFALE